MPYLKLLNRRRELVRGRPRPTANSNFITIKKSGTVYSLTFKPVASPYVFYLLYVAPQSQPIGYKNNPIPDPPYVLIGAQTEPQSLVPPDLLNTSLPVISSPPSVTSIQPVVSGATIPQDSLPVAQTASQIAAYDNGNSFQLILKTSPSRIYQGATPSKLVLILANQNNLGDIFIGFSPAVNSQTGMRIPAGSGVSIPISDAGSIYIVAQNNTDSISGFYLV